MTSSLSSQADENPWEAIERLTYLCDRMTDRLSATEERVDQAVRVIQGLGLGRVVDEGPLAD